METLCQNDLVRKATGVTLIVASLVYAAWLAADLRSDDLWLSLPFLLANSFLICLLFVTVHNNWRRLPLAVAAPAPFAEPRVAVLVPTLNEPPGMVRRTLESVLAQDWPHDRLVVIVGDDGHRPAVRAMVEDLQRSHPAVLLHYHLPPRRHTPARRGDAKDGNLNSMLGLVAREAIAFVETRDADDLVGDPRFLRHTVGHLVRHPDVAYVQTVKDCLVSPGDPFGNRRRFFYRGIMLSRAAAGAAFPCGSGLVWRRADLEAIGGFPTWNLVEDLYSGYLALQHGMRGAYLPIDGAVGQVAPEDLPNVYKQLGTWAMDTMRIFFWRSPLTTRGLTFRQRLQFLEVGLFYLSSIPTLVLILTPACCLLFDVRLFQDHVVAHVVYSTGYVLLLAAYMFVLGNGTSWREVLRAKQMWVGLMFVHSGACLRALWYGPRRKPAYRVTRKVQRAGLYLKEVAPHLALVALFAAAIVRHLLLPASGRALDRFDLGSVFWVVDYGILLFAFIRRSWFGLGRTGQAEPEMETIMENAAKG
ncbi:glycosyltransferase [Actinomadura sp. DC4]|uniref:glycosyltransferase n=1 Tax=Actinomadura sp. DC4 TaxID=3055069 RepID=UPI0025B2063F|nr:glycosyltransferase [Actinomadura sp. DC4]MDN3352028.1 glycosyltransferase [Actinomadura sp. DC4]